ncbi:MAG TPA: hypothetical protein ENN19_01380 [Chloroflexi bacterium]|nr:hypothetical protein [Chloroflexota bacterium]
MRKTILGSNVLSWGLHVVFALLALVPVLLALVYSADYDIFYVPFASWFVFGLSALILILDGLALCLRVRLHKASQLHAHLTQDPIRDEIPVIYGHKFLDMAEFLPIIQSLFGRLPDVRSIQLEPLPGGYGGSQTVLVKLQQKSDASMLPRSFVVKLGDRREMAGERDKFQRHVRWRLTRAATLLGYAEWEGWAGTAYEFVGIDPDYEIQSFYQFYRGHAAVEVSALVDETYARLDQAWYRRGKTHPMELYCEYSLLRKKQQSIVEHIGELVDEDDPYRRNFTVIEEKLQPHLKPRFCSEMDVPWHDPVAFLRTWPRSNRVVPIHRSTVHGDLNSRNVLVEIGAGGQKFTWFIDFSHTGNGLSQARTEERLREGIPVDGETGHTLRDFCRLEADVKFILTRLWDEGDLNLAVAFERELLKQGVTMKDWQAVSLHAEALRDRRFRKAWQVVRTIRSYAANYLGNTDDWRPYCLSLLHATLPIVYYHPDQFERTACERQQKRYALISAGMLCDLL